MLPRNLSLISLLICLCACSSTPNYGYSNHDWENLSEQEKNHARAEYDQMIKLKNEQRHRDLIMDQRDKIIERGLETTYPVTQ